MLHAQHHLPSTMWKQEQHGIFPVGTGRVKGLRAVQPRHREGAESRWMSGREVGLRIAGGELCTQPLSHLAVFAQQEKGAG